ncbi:hypothetical protein ASF49_03410 [Methylobacterium sp. Leaf104]|uniref:DUF805 domain-containing protein n=1 Tax=Methylobacterium TaxID=407 RepID=UPI0006F3CADE|nr:DUF805 domain-containing protein [Methylobacterium sp. Leaf104]KQP42880.1 hypothetical protein ASF49_03410 [Methylobacterium sp. Leaf104]MCI9878523.1 DUF805 domain-containing protein [Methylobacterium goesingense]
MTPRLRAALALYDPRGRLAAPAYRQRLIRTLLLGFGLLCLGIWLASLGLRWAGFLAVAGILPVLAALAIQTIRRLHDRNRSGLWLAAYAVAEAVSVLPLERAVDTHPLPVIALVLAMLGFLVWFFVETVVRSGSPGANRYGPDPRAP